MSQCGKCLILLWVYWVIWLSQIVKISNSRSSPGRNFDRTSVKNHSCRCSGLTLKPDRPLDFKVSFPGLQATSAESWFQIGDNKMALLRLSTIEIYRLGQPSDWLNLVCTFILVELNWSMAITPRNHSRMWWWSRWSWVNFGVAEYKSKIIPILIQFWPNRRSNDIERYLQTHSKHFLHEYTPLHNQIKNSKIRSFMMKYGGVLGIMTRVIYAFQILFSEYVKACESFSNLT